MRIAILAPYGRNETTQAAIRLADMLETSSVNVHFIARDVHERSVNAFWDHRVRKPRHYAATIDADAWIFFGHESESARQVAVRDNDSRKILISSWRSLFTDAALNINFYDDVVCPSRHMYEALTARLDANNTKLSWCKWDSGLPPTVHDGAVDPSHLRVAVMCDHTSIDFCGPMVLTAIDQLLATHGRLEITLLSYKSWGRRDHQSIRHLRISQNRRFTVSPVGFTIDLARILNASDWCFLPSLRSEFGFAASFALSCGTPVICYDIPPLNERVVHGHNGILIQCEMQADGTAMPVLPNVLSACSNAFNTNHPLLQMQVKDWRLGTLAYSFECFWKNLLHVS